MLFTIRLNILFLLLSCNCFAETYTFNSIQYLAEQEVGRIVLPAIYKKLGIGITIVPLPGKRAQIEVIEGRADGEIMRIWTYGAETPTAVRVPTPYYQLETTAFVLKNSGITITSKSELAPYRIVKVSGVKHTNNVSEGMPHVHDLSNASQMMEFLRAGRADIALTNTINGLMELRRLKYSDIVPAGKPLEVLELYHYIHEDHRALVPRVDAVIKEMIASGEMQALIQKAESKVLGNDFTYLAQ